MELLRWLRTGSRLAVPVVAIGLAAAEARPVRAQAAPGSAVVTVEELQKALEARDRLITAMQRRMDELERRLMVSAPRPSPAERPPAPPAPRSEPPRTAQSAPQAPAPGEIKVDEAAVATALERALVQQGALLLPAGTAQIQPSLSYTRQEADAPAFVVQETDLVTADELRQNNLTAGLTFRLGLPLNSQLALSVPYRYTDTSTVTRVNFANLSETSRDASGLGDLAVTVSKGLLRERGWRPDLIARLTWDTDSGQTDSGVPLGSGFHEIAASLTATKSQDPLVFVGSLSYQHAIEDGNVQPGETVGLSLGTVLAASPETSLRFFLDQNFIGNAERNGREVPGSDAVVSLFSVGASSIINSGVFLDVELGIGLSESAPDYRVSVSLPFRF